MIDLISLLEFVAATAGANLARCELALTESKLALICDSADRAVIVVADLVEQVTTVTELWLGWAI